jgi:hypothetical protein
MSNKCDYNQILEWRQKRMRWDWIANELYISISTLRRWRIDVDFEDPIKFNDITIEEIDQIVLKYIAERPNVGGYNVGAYLRRIGVNVHRWVVRECLARVDQAGIDRRSRRLIKRTVYHSLGPFHMIHFDGHHKLIKWGLVTHGGIDGDTRLVFCLRCSNNNRADTALRCFKEGVKEYQLPMRVRVDAGGENVKIAEYMLRKRGLNQRIVLVGTSRFNTRIERLWRDVRTNTIQFYMDLFNSFNDMGMDTHNIMHKYVLHAMFLDRINEGLDLFAGVWNNHKISTENFRTPLELLVIRKDLTAPALGEPAEEYASSSGSDIGSENSSENSDESIPAVEVEDVHCPFSEEEDKDYFHNTIEPFTLNDVGDTLSTRFFDAINFAKDIIEYRNNNPL